ncbi:MAG: hypothetical protein JWN44_3767 [Myxococcales bacterium]|nr:hypothetical protein [Myxococcales bacterium]
MRLHDGALEELWNAAAAVGAPFRAAEIAGLPEPARRYLTHAIAEGTPSASAVRLRMHGQIRLGAWHPFEAEQVIRWNRGFVWKARVKMRGLPVVGSDRWIDGQGAMRWKMLGIIPVWTAAGPDISRAALGRVQIESIWLPSMLLAPEVGWHVTDATHAVATVSMRGHEADIRVALDGGGRATSVWMERWGNPDGGAFAFSPFGGIVDDEATFGGYTIPSKLRIGWHFAGERFEKDGESFHATIDDATFR